MKLNYLVNDVMAPCFSEHPKREDCEAVIRKVNEVLTEKEMNLLCDMVGAAINLAWFEGHN